MTNFVQMYRSTDLNAPVLSGEQGKLVDLLNTVLVTGYTTTALNTTITHSGAIATATITNPNTTLRTGNWVTISGCTGTDSALYNGTFQITVDSSTQIRYTMTGTPTGNSTTGSPVYAKASLGWTKPFSDTGRGAFLPQAITGYPRFYLYVNDNNPTADGTNSYKQAAVRGYETISGNIDSGLNPFPTISQAANGICWRKSTTVDTTARPWVLIGNGRTFYFVPNSDSSLTLGRGFCGFGGFETYKVGDQYNCFINGWAGFATTSQASAGSGLAYGNIGGTFSTTGGAYAARSVAQVGTPPILGGFIGLTGAATTLGGTSGVVEYPAAADTGTWFQSPLVCETAANRPRGRLSGLYSHCHNTLVGTDGDEITNVAGLTGVTLSCVSITSATTQGQIHLDITGPW
jgi:hypothetical protein